MRVFDDEAYHELICDIVLFDVISGGNEWIKESSWEALDAGNISQAVFDVTNCNEPDRFAKYGLDDLSQHSQALALVDAIHRLGF